MKQNPHAMGQQLVSLLETAFLAGEETYNGVLLLTDYGYDTRYFTLIELSSWSKKVHATSKTATLSIYIQEPLPDLWHLPVTIFYLKDSKGGDHLPNIEGGSKCPNATQRRYTNVELGHAIRDMYTYLTTGMLYHPQPS